jgi:hypothetical protein
MIRAPFILLILAASPFAFAMDLGAWRELRVHVDAIAEPILVNGLPLMVSRATGIDVGRLASRIDQKWREESGDHGVRFSTHDNWRILSRIQGDTLEVAQWRGTGSDAELLWSRTDLLTKTRLPAQGGIRLPTGCVPGRTVSGQIVGRRYSQQSARCMASPITTLADMRESALGQGYAVLLREGQLLARNKTSEITVLAWSSGDAVPNATSVAYLQVELSERGR